MFVDAVFLDGRDNGPAMTKLWGCGFSIFRALGVLTLGDSVVTSPGRDNLLAYLIQ